eukprot:9151995-Lingulodinium_polyedra.AAC.1
MDSPWQVDCPWIVHRQGSPWILPAQSMDCPRVAHGQPMDIPWTAHGLAMGWPGAIPVLPMDHGQSMD